MTRFTMAGLYNCGVATKAVLEVAQWGFLTMQVVGGLNELSQGHGFTGAFDLVTAAVPFLFKRSCFTAETPVMLLDGCKRIADLVEGDLVLSRDERDPDAPVVARVVEEVFVTEGAIWHLHVGEQVIRTTPEHPFWVKGKGWVAAGFLEPGDLLSTHDGRWLPVEEVFDTGEREAVYNCRVAEHHTYFVGCADWGFSLWAHNTCKKGDGSVSSHNAMEKNYAEGYDLIFGKKGSKAPAKTVKGYRVVEDAELQDIIARGKLRFPKGGDTPTGKPGKWFYLDRAAALDTGVEWASHGREHFTLIRVKVPGSSITFRQRIDATSRMPGGKRGIFSEFELGLGDAPVEINPPP